MVVKQAARLLQEVAQLEEKIAAAQLPAELKERTSLMIQRLNRLANLGLYSHEYERVADYVDWLVRLPWQNSSQDILDLTYARQILDKNHFGLNEVKERILEYIAVLKLQKGTARAPILCFIGLVGSGKTTIAASIAAALGRKLARIPFGGLANPLDLRGQSKLQPEAEPGLIVKALARVGTKNPVILLDEIDRVADQVRGSLMGVLIELLDPEQNHAFVDHFIDFPFDLSQVLFVATANHAANISVAVMDRLEVIQMPSYSDEEKITIGKKYLLPRVLKNIGLKPATIKIDDSVWPQIVRPLGYDAGVRTLERTIEGIGRKVAKMIVEGQARSFHLTKENIKEFLPTWY